jgi:CRISPR-associated endonuclease Csn1
MVIIRSQGMGIFVGLDIGSNSVGSAAIDTVSGTIRLGVGIFPAGVDETELKRGAPLNQKRRQKRSLRRGIARRAKRKLAVRKLLTAAGFLPPEGTAWDHLAAGSDLASGTRSQTPWQLRRDALVRAITPHEMGRVLLHLSQRRGASGVQVDPDDPEQGQVKQAMDYVAQQLNGRTFGQMIADLDDERQHQAGHGRGTHFHDPVRNRQDRLNQFTLVHAGRSLIREEFHTIWEKQRELGGAVSSMLTDEFMEQLDNPVEDGTWRHKGAIFGQRKTYWDAGTLGRCDLEPSDHRCPFGDMHAQEFRVLETVNNVRIEERGQSPRKLDAVERAVVIEKLSTQKACSIATIRKAIGIDKKAVKDFFSLNIERDADREINTDWFAREVVHGAFTKPVWDKLSAEQHESVNRALLKLDPEIEMHVERLRHGATEWWGLNVESTERLLAAWTARPDPDRRANLSRRAISNLLPYLRTEMTVSEARQNFAKDAESGATPDQRRRYSLNPQLVLTKRDRRFLRQRAREGKPVQLPPAPVLANPVARKALHEVRRHINAYLRLFGRAPDRIVIELTRKATQTERQRDAQLKANRDREAIRKAIARDFELPDPYCRGVDRVMLCIEQRCRCAYSDRTITLHMAADGEGLEIDHIIPMSRCQDNGFNNKVLCFRDANRTKGSQTPKEWLTPEGFLELQTRFKHLANKVKTREGAYEIRPNPRKWENLRRDALRLTEPLERERWANSQLSDTAYAATQVGAYLRDALYDGERDGKRRIFFTKGSYTAILRRDWQLVDDEGPKDRTDHRHHAVDAVAIALTGPEIIQDLAHHAELQEKAKAEQGRWPHRTPLPPPKPWHSVQTFRGQVMSVVQALVVRHRPTKRKIVGYLHKDDTWGAVDEAEGIFRIRCNVAALTPKMLLERVKENDEDVRSRLFKEIKKAIPGMPDKEARKKALLRFEHGSFERQLIDPSLGKGGLVRDWKLREIIRDALQANGIDPAAFTSKQVVDFAQSGKLRMPSGVPITSVITIAPISDPVKIAVRDPLTSRQAINFRTKQPLFRYHVSRNNHHVEIRSHVKTGKWSGECIRTVDAVHRVRPSADAQGNRQKSRPAVDRSERDEGTFIMSLSEGEVVHARRNDRRPEERDAVGFFVVVKLDKNRLHFAPHWDARGADEQDRWDVSFSNLKQCEPIRDKPPYKVRIDAIGNVIPLTRD